MIEADIVQKMEQISAEVFLETPVLFAYIFGSYSTGQQHRFSDLDIAVFADQSDSKKRLELELQLALVIDETLGHCVQSDVRTVNYLPLAVQGAILTGGRLIYCRDDDERVAFETRTRMRYFDFKPVIDHYLKTYQEGLGAAYGIR